MINCNHSFGFDVDIYHKISSSACCFHKKYFTLITCIIVAEECETNEKGNRMCVFPFGYGGKWYMECTWEDWGASWCGMSVDNNGIANDYATCTPDTCPGAQYGIY